MQLIRGTQGEKGDQKHKAVDATPSPGICCMKARDSEKQMGKEHHRSIRETQRQRIPLHTQEEAGPLLFLQASPGHKGPTQFSGLMPALQLHAANARGWSQDKLEVKTVLPPLQGLTGTLLFHRLTTLPSR